MIVDSDIQLSYCMGTHGNTMSLGRYVYYFHAKTAIVSHYNNQYPDYVKIKTASV